MTFFLVQDVTEQQKLIDLKVQQFWDPDIKGLIHSALLVSQPRMSGADKIRHCSLA